MMPFQLSLMFWQGKEPTLEWSTKIRKLSDIKEFHIVGFKLLSRSRHLFLQHWQSEELSSLNDWNGSGLLFMLWQRNDLIGLTAKLLVMLTGTTMAKLPFIVRTPATRNFLMKLNFSFLGCCIIEGSHQRYQHLLQLILVGTLC
jgi:hypothetical protein